MVLLSQWLYSDDDDCTTYFTCVSKEENDTLKLTKEKKYIFYLIAGVFCINEYISYKKILKKNDKEIKNILKEKRMSIKSYEIIKNNIDKYEDTLEKVKEMYNNTTVKELRSLVEKHFIPTKEEKEKNAEIHTPRELVDNMFEQMPKEFFEEPNKVFDPCCGKGNFVLGLFEKFFEGLKNMYPRKKERCKIIATQCIYFADLTTLNVYITSELLKAHIKRFCGFMPDYNFNSNIGNTLDLNIHNTWKIDGFEAVVGNPPYNNGQDNKGKKGGGDALWPRMVKAMIKNLVKGGFLLFVHPSGWRKPESTNSKFKGLFELMTKENQMLYLEIHDTKDGMKTFGCGTRYDIYLIEHKKKYKNTEVIDEKGVKSRIDMSEWEWLPNFDLSNIRNILALNCDKRCEILFSRSAYGSDKSWVQSIKDNSFKYPCVHSTPQKGHRFYYSKKNDNGHFNVPKVIFGESGIYNAIMDVKGRYGMTHGCMGIIDDVDNFPSIKKGIESKKFKNMLKACSWGNFRIDWRMFSSFRKDFWKEFI
jgi:hypothetical protein